MTATLSLSIIIIYFAVLLIIARLTSRKTSAGAFFDGDKSSPWYLVAFGTIGASISGVTFVSVPGEVGHNAWHYLQFIGGNFIGYLIIAAVLIPLYYRLKLVSIYDYLRQRFGWHSHKTGAAFFLLSQFIGASFRLFLVVGVMQILIFDEMGVPFWATTGISLLMIWAYIRQSGIKTIVWTDTLQTASIIVAVIATVAAISDGMGINLTQLVEEIAEHPSCDIIDTDISSPSHWLKQILSGIAIVIVMNGLDQNIMQKSLTCKNKREAQKNLCTFSVAFVATNILFVALGTALYIFAQYKGVETPQSTDDLFPMIVKTVLPQGVGIAFLIGIIAAAYSSADSSLTALTTVMCIDIMELKIDAPETKKIRERTTIVLAILMMLTICIFRAVNDRSIVSAIFTIAGYTYGPLLGLFAFGILTDWQTREKAVPWIAIAAPIISWIISICAPILWGYKMGFELILINGGIVFAGLCITSIKKQRKRV